MNANTNMVDILPFRLKIGGNRHLSALHITVATARGEVTQIPSVASKGNVGLAYFESERGSGRRSRQRRWHHLCFRCSVDPCKNGSFGVEYSDPII